MNKNGIYIKEPTTKQAVLATLAYFNIFGIPLTRHELSEYLIFKTVDQNKIDIYLKESPLIRSEDGYFSLGLDKRDFQAKFDRSKQFWKKVMRFQFLFSICPFVKLVCVCNSLCINATDQNSDIDLLVITKKNRLFMARLFITLLTSIFGVRRHGNKITKRFCLSFFISENNLDLSKIAIEPHDIYLAYWIKTLQPISGDYETYEKLLKENGGFLKSYFPNPALPNKRYFRKTAAPVNTLKNIFEKMLGASSLNEKIRAYQLWRAHSKMEALPDKSGTIISGEMLKFHDNDLRNQIKDNWESALKKIF